MGLLYFVVAPNTMFAQGCPSLVLDDFTTQLIAGSSDCGNKGELQISYRNTVTGFWKIVYEVSSDGSTYTPYETRHLDVPTIIPLTEWTPAQPIHLRVKAYCRGDLTPLQLTLPTLTYSTIPSEQVGLRVTTTAASGCLGTNGIISVHLNKVAGFSAVTYVLVKGGSNIASETTTTPYSPVEFAGLSSGNYKIIAKATPACPPTTPPSHYKDGAYSVEENVKVENFILKATPLSATGSCQGGVRIDAGRTTGIASMNYRLERTDAVMSPLVHTAMAPNLSYTFTGLSAGNYKLTATAACGASEQTTFTVNNNNFGALHAAVTRTPYAACPTDGLVRLHLEGVNAASSVVYNLSKAGAVVATKTSTAKEVEFNNITPGTYDVEAIPCGGTPITTSFTLSTGNLGTVTVKSTLSYPCEASSRLDFELSGGTYYKDITASLFVNGVEVNRKVIEAGKTQGHFENLIPNKYTLRLSNDCGEFIEKEVKIGIPGDENSFPSVSLLPVEGIDFCNPAAPTNFHLIFKDKGFAPYFTHFRILQGSTVVASGNGLKTISITPKGSYYPEKYWATSAFQLAPGTYKAQLLPDCGYPIVEKEVEYKPITTLPKINPTLLFDPPCLATSYGTPYYNSNFNFTVDDDIDGRMTNFVFELKRNGTLFDSKKMYTAMQKGKIYVAPFSRFPEGNYTISYYPECNPSLRSEEAAFSVDPSATPIRTINTTAAECIQYGSLTWKETSDKNYNNVTFELKKADGTKFVSSNQNYNNKEYRVYDLPAGNYTFTVTIDNGCATPEVLTYPINIAFSPSTNSNMKWLKIREETLPTNICTGEETNDGKLKVQPDLYNFRIQKPSGAGFYSITSTDGTQNWTHPVSDVTQETELTGFTYGKSYDIKLVSNCGEILLDNSYIPKKNIIEHYDGIPNGPFKKIEATPYSVCTQPSLTFEINPDVLSAGEKTKPITVKISERDSDNEVLTTTLPVGTLTYHHEFSLPPDVSSPSYRIEVSTPCATTLLYYAYFGKVDLDNYSPYFYTKKSVNSYANTKGTIMLNAASYLDRFLEEAEFTLYDAETNTPLRTLQNITSLKDLMFDNIGIGRYYIKSKIKDKCGQTFTKTSSILVMYEEKEIFDIKVVPITCTNNGELHYTLRKKDNHGNSLEGWKKITYVVTDYFTGTFVKQTATITPYEKMVINGLGPRTYKVTATLEGIFDGQFVTKEWSTAHSFSSSYQTLSVEQFVDNETNISTQCAPYAGKIKLSIIQGDIENKDYTITLNSGPSQGGPYPRVITRKGEDWNNHRGRDDWYENYWSWNRVFIAAEQLPPGDYNLTLSDGCSSSTTTAKITPLALEGFPELKRRCINSGTDAEWYIDLEKMKGPGYFSYSGERWENSIWKEIFEHPERLELAVVKGTTAPVATSSEWKSLKDFALLNSVYNWLDKYETKSVFARYKDCPSIVIGPYTTTNNLTENWWRSDVGTNTMRCDVVSYYVRRKATSCGDGLAILKNADTGVEVERKVIGYNENYTSPSYPSNQNYTLTFTALGESVTYNIPKRDYTYDIRLENPERMLCDGRLQLTFQFMHTCYEGLRYVIKEKASGTVVEETISGFRAYNWKPSYRFQQNVEYLIEIYTTGSSTTPVYTRQFKVNFPLADRLEMVETNHNCQGRVGWNMLLYKYNNTLPQNIQGAMIETPVTLKITRPDGTIRYGYAESNASPYLNSDLTLQDFPIQLDFRYFDEGGNPISGTSTEERNWFSLSGNYTIELTTACGRKLTASKNLIANRPREMQLNYTLQQTECGKVNLIPGNSATYVDELGVTQTATGYTDVIISNQTNYDLDIPDAQGQWHPVGTPIGIPLAPGGSTQIKLIFPSKAGVNNGCYLYQTIHVTNTSIKVDALNSYAFFCTGTNKGNVYAAASGGVPPYTFTYRKDSATGPVVHTQTTSGVALYEGGNIGDSFYIDITDKCGNQHVGQTQTILSSADISYSLKKSITVQEGKPLYLFVMNLPSSTYRWVTPSGTNVMGESYNLTSTPMNAAGLYKLYITTPNCGSAIQVDYQVNVVNITESTIPSNQALCQGEQLSLNIGASQVVLNGTAITPTYYWERSSDGVTFTTFPNNNSEVLSLTPTEVGTFYYRRATYHAGITEYSAVSTVQITPGPTQSVSTNELNLIARRGKPFVVTAGLLDTKGLTPTFQWQRSFDQTTWTNVGASTDAIYVENAPPARRQLYYRRYTTVGTCTILSPVITVQLKGRSSYINPHLRLRVKQ